MDFALERRHMVQHQLRGRGISDERLLAVMEEVPRHLFVPERLRTKAYDDEPLSIGVGQTISQPYMVARMTELLRLTGTEIVLEVGTGSGYQAAVLGRLAAEVWTIERHTELATQAKTVLADLGMENVHVLVGDGTLGLPDHAPFDRIIVTAAAPRVPQALRDQLAVGGKMVIPIAAQYNEELVLVEKLPAGGDPGPAFERAPDATGGETRAGGAGAADATARGTAPDGAAPPSRFRETTILGCVFVPLIGKHGYPK
jgi:protein-L-isoaspartate(D-aspartate) O-methyltransferase